MTLKNSIAIIGLFCLLLPACQGTKLSKDYQTQDPLLVSPKGNTPYPVTQSNNK